MPGVRLHHVECRNTNVVFELPDRPYPGGPFLCSTCSKAHINKAVHLRVNGDGDVFVAEEAFDNLRPYLGSEWKVMGLAQEVPPMMLGFEGRSEQFNIEFREV
jgi:hypothetical protein